LTSQNFALTNKINALESSEFNEKNIVYELKLAQAKVNNNIIKDTKPSIKE